MKTLSLFSIKRPVTISMFFLCIAFVGIYAFTRLGVDLLPNVDIPHLMVQTNYANATPEEIEKLITEPLESAAATVTGVKKITSVSKESISVISIDFVWGTDINFALISLREKLDNMSFALPREAGRPTIIRANPSSSPIVSLVLSYSNGSSKEIVDSSQNRINWRANRTEFVDHDSSPEEIKRLIDLKEAARVVFKRRFEQLEGVAQAVITGGLEREILVEVEPQKLTAYNLTYDEITTALSNSNINLPAGTIMKGLFRYSLRMQGEFRNADEIKETIIKRYNNGRVILLKDIALVSENFKEREGLTRLNGSEAVGILIYKEPESNTVTIASKVKDAVKVLSSEYPEFDLLVASDQSGFIESAIINVKQEILYGGILAVLVLFFFLGSLRHIFIIGITIPSSLVLTVLLMYMFNINFNIISLGGIALGIGMLLDNAIVVIENIVRYKESGHNYRDAALHGSNEVAMPVVAATLTTIVVFLPLIFLPGIAGELFKDQSYAIMFSLSSSILAAITLVPMLASREKFTLIRNKQKFSQNYLFINYPPRKGIFSKVFFWLKFPFIFVIKSIFYLLIKFGLIVAEFFKKIFESFSAKVDRHLNKVIDKYENLLEWSLNNKKTVLLITVLLLILAVAAIADMKKEFMPESPQDEFIVEVDFPKGTSLKGNAAITSNIEERILSFKKVRSVVSNIGRVNEFDFMNKEQLSVNKTNLIIKLFSYEDYYDVQNRVRKLFERTNGIKYSFQKVKTAYTQVIQAADDDIVIKIKSKDIESSFKKSEEIVERINKANIEGIQEVRLAIEKGTPEYNIKIDREQCLSYGVSLSSAANQIVNLVKGNHTISFSDFDKKINVNVKAGSDQINSIAKVLNTLLIVENKKIPIDELITYKLTNSYSEIWREDQARTIYIYAGLGDINLDEAIKKVNTVVSGIPKNKEELITIGGVNEEITDSFEGLYAALLISVVLMYMVLASEFESFLFPFIIIFSVPLGLIGGILLLYIFGESISIISLMGLIILVGIADNDAVVKVEFILRKRREGLPVREAIIQAGKDRFRPIVMNSLTVIFGLIPMIIGIGAGTQLRISLSLAIAGGLVSSTFLTLIIIPVLYTYMEKWSRKEFN